MTKRWLVLILVLTGLTFLPVISGAAELPPLLVHVMDQSGRPIGKAEVRAGNAPSDRVEGREAVETIVSAETSTLGIARLSGLPADRNVWVLIERPGFTPEVQDVLLLPGEPPRELRVILRPGGTAVGRVLDEKGRPVAGAEVEISGDPFGISMRPVYGEPQDLSHLPSFLLETARHRTRTGPGGRFRFHDLPEGPFDLTIRHPLHAPFLSEHPITGGVAGPLGRFILRRGQTLTGTVTDASGRPVAGARIWNQLDLAGGESVPPPVVTTGADGSFTIRGQEPREVVICAEGFLKEKVRIDFPEDPVQVRLNPATTIRGRVLGPEGEPLAGVEVHPSGAGWLTTCIPSPDDPPPCATNVPGTTDAEGRFVIGPLTPDWYTLWARKPGFVDGSVERLRSAAGVAVEGVEIRLGRGAVVTGRVTDPDSLPIRGAAVQASSYEGFAEGRTTDDGSFRLEGVASGPVFVSANADGYTSAGDGYLEDGVEIDPAVDQTPVHLVLTRRDDLTEIRGHVFSPEGKPVAGARVSSIFQRSTSAPDGSFVLRFRQPTRHPIELTAEKQGFARRTLSVPITGHRAEGVEIHLERGASITGRISGLDERELRSAKVGLTGPETNWIEMSAPIDSSGRFRLGPVPSGHWRVLLEKEPFGWVVEKQVVIDPGETEVLVDLEAPPTHVVSGRVWDPDGMPAAGIPVGSTRARADGTFELKRPDGLFDLSISGPGFATFRLPVRVEGEPVTGLEIRLERGTTVRGRLVGLAPQQVPEIWAESDRGTKRAQVDLDGGWRLADLAPGRWTVTGVYRSDSKKWIVEVPPGGEEIEMDLEFGLEEKP